jgi:microcystin-dependent protein
MAEPFLSEIRMFSFGFAPKGWALCNGQLMPINQNQALFALLGTTFGGDGRTNFALPDLRGQLPIHFGNGHVLGESAGEENHTLSYQETPVHAHPVIASSSAPDSPDPTGAFWASNTGRKPYSASPDSPMSPAATPGPGGGNQPHNNMPPFLVISFCIALQGIFPSRG